MGRIIWLSTADDSWGECLPSELIVIPFDELTREEYYMYIESEEYDSVRKALELARDRMAEDAAQSDAELREAAADLRADALYDYGVRTEQLAEGDA